MSFREKSLLVSGVLLLGKDTGQAHTKGSGLDPVDEWRR